MPTIIGIDPGLDGVVIVLDNKKLEHVFQIPTYKVTLKNGKMRREYDIAKTRAIFRNIKDKYGANCYAILEQMFPNPMNGHLTAYKKGEGMMLMKCCLDAYDIPYNTIDPKEWKKKYGLINKKNKMTGAKKKKDHNDSIKKIFEMYPEYESQVMAFRRAAVRQGVADAILIGLTWWSEK